MSLRDRVALFTGVWGWWRDPYKPSPAAQQSLADLRQRAETLREETAELARLHLTPCDRGNHYGCGGCVCTCHPRSSR